MPNDTEVTVVIDLDEIMKTMLMVALILFTAMLAPLVCATSVETEGFTCSSPLAPEQVDTYSQLEDSIHVPGRRLSGE